MMVPKIIDSCILGMMGKALIFCQKSIQSCQSVQPILLAGGGDSPRWLKTWGGGSIREQPYFRAFYHTTFYYYNNHTSVLSYLPYKVTRSQQTVLYSSPAALKTRALVQSAASLTNTDDLLKFRGPARALLISSSRRSWLMLLLAFQGYAMVDTLGDICQNCKDGWLKKCVNWCNQILLIVLYRC